MKNAIKLARRDDFEDRKERIEMAFGCVLYLKEECDGCGLCEEQRRLRNLGDEESILEEMGY